MLRRSHALSPKPLSVPHTPSASRLDFTDRCVVKSYSGMVYALSLANGSQIWSAKHILGAGGGGTTIVGSVAYMGSWNRFVYAHDMNTGRVIWTFEAKGEVRRTHG